MNIVTKVFLFFIVTTSTFSSALQQHSGNFANPRKPITNFGFGQNIVHKNAVVLYADTAQQKGQRQNLITLSPAFLYGIRDNLSIYAAIPVIGKLILNGKRYKGVGDLQLQLEYAFFKKSTNTSINQATLVTNITLPTGNVFPISSAVRRPATGFGAPSFFFGGTVSHLSVNWYAFASDGGIITTTTRSGNRVGGTFFYQFGVGRNLGNPFGTTLMGLFEFNGIFTRPNTNYQIPNCNSGGNTIFVGPSLYITRGLWVFEGGIQGPVVQHLNGIQTLQRYRTLFELSVKF